MHCLAFVDSWLLVTLYFERAVCVALRSGLCLYFPGGGADEMRRSLRLSLNRCTTNPVRDGGGRCWRFVRLAPFMPRRRGDADGGDADVDDADERDGDERDGGKGVGGDPSSSSLFCCTVATLDRRSRH